MSAHERHQHGSRQVEHRGVLVEGLHVIKYETSHPAPRQWIALGLVSEPTGVGASLVPRLMVGNGATELAALRNLQQRVAGPVFAREEAESIRDWVHSEIDEPDVSG